MESFNGLLIENLRVSFPTAEGMVQAVDSIDLRIPVGEKTGLIGETGCGKTVIGLAIMRLLQPDAIIEGDIVYNGVHIPDLTDDEMRQMRGKEIAIILQNTASSLNPVMKIGDQIAEVIRIHSGKSRQDAQNEVIRMLEEVQISDPERCSEQYPFEFSGGMNERVMVSMALAGNPSFIIADEPTTGLDLITKSQIIKLFKEVSRERSMLFITHDLDAAAEVCDMVAVMYCGEIIEYGETEKVFSSPAHPYTRGLLSSLPRRGLHPIPGMSPSLLELPEGCRYYGRCGMAEENCRMQHPDFREVEKGHFVRCFRND